MKNADVKVYEVIGEEGEENEARGQLGEIGANGEHVEPLDLRLEVKLLFTLGGGGGVWGKLRSGKHTLYGKYSSYLLMNRDRVPSVVEIPPLLH
jgi:hypothetical protein